MCFAVQQHQDIIAVNYPARRAGVKKHMSPAEVRSQSSKTRDSCSTVSRPLLGCQHRSLQDALVVPALGCSCCFPTWKPIPDHLSEVLRITCAGSCLHCVADQLQPALQARAILKGVGGCLVHVHTEAGGRISYEPYRQAGKEVLQLLETVPWASTVEKGSIDEAYLLFTGGPEQSADALSDDAATALAESLRQQCAYASESLGLLAARGH